LFPRSNLLSRDLLPYDSNDLGSNSMKKLRILVSLVSNENDYQREQARAVTEMAERLGAEVQIIYADGDSINQS